jgi:hypothetical protein
MYTNICLKRGLAPDLGQHAVVARALALRHLDVVALEVLHAAAHVEREVEHPLLIVALGLELAYHGLLLRCLTWCAITLYAFRPPV